MTQVQELPFVCTWDLMLTSLINVTASSDYTFLKV